VGEGEAEAVAVGVVVGEGVLLGVEAGDLLGEGAGSGTPLFQMIFFPDLIAVYFFPRQTIT